jgi:hypothetical protein
MLFTGNGACKILERDVKQYKINQSSEQASNQSINQAIKQSINISLP